MEPFVILTILILNAVIAIWQAHVHHCAPMLTRFKSYVSVAAPSTLGRSTVEGWHGQDSKAEKALDALKKLAPECAMVLRNGSWQSTLDRSAATSTWKEQRSLFGK